MNLDPFWCKHCGTEFLIEVPPGYTGDALIACPTEECRWRHPRQFVGGTAVSCDPLRREPLIIEVLK